MGSETLKSMAKKNLKGNRGTTKRKPKKVATKTPKAPKAAQVQAPAIVSPQAAMASMAALADEQLVNALQPDAVRNMDLDTLKESMTRGIYVLETVLFSQAQFEFGRISRQRSLIEQLEKQIFDPKTLSEMSATQKAGLYHTLQNSMQNSLNFVMDLHGSVKTGMEAVATVEKMKANKVKPQQQGGKDPKVEHVRAKIMEFMKKKAEGQS